MSNPTAKKLQDILDDLRAQRDTLDEQINHFEGVLSYLAQNPEKLEPRPVPTKGIRNAMWEILHEERRAMHFKEIYQKLVDRGVPVPGKEPVRNVGAHLSADERFDSLGQGMWGLESWKRSTHQAPTSARESDRVVEREHSIANPFDAILGDDFDDPSASADRVPTALPVRGAAYAPTPAASRGAVSAVAGMKTAIQQSSEEPDYDDIDDVPF